MPWVPRKPNSPTHFLVVDNNHVNRLDATVIMISVGVLVPSCDNGAQAVLFECISTAFIAAMKVGLEATRAITSAAISVQRHFSHSRQQLPKKKQ